MNDELFPIACVTKLTPRAEFMKRHSLVIQKGWSDWHSKEMWFCWNRKEIKGAGRGETEHDAICDWCEKNNHRLWNEEAQ